MAVLTSPNDLIKANANPPTDDLIKTEESDLGWQKNGDGFDQWEPKPIISKTVAISPSLSATIFQEDDNFGKRNWIKDAMSKITSSEKTFPLED